MKESKKSRLTHARLKELMNYDPGTGVFVWKVSKGSRAQEGSRAGCRYIGYVRCSIDGSYYLAHRLACLYVHGYFPENNLDHINRDRADNRIENLREVSQQCNIRNSGQFKNNTSGVKGVCWNKQEKKWCAKIMITNKHHGLGHYKSKHNAVCARLAAEQCLGWAGCDSNSPAYQYVQNMLSGV